MRSKLLVGVVVVVMVAAFLWRHQETEHPRPARPQPESVERALPSAHSVNVRRLAPPERKQLGEKIHAALRKAGSNATTDHQAAGGSPPALADEPILRLEEIGPNVMATLESTIPEFAKCYDGKTTVNKAPIAIMEMVSDQELGTVIDTTLMIDADGNPLPKDVDDCLRETADSLSLPPLGKQGRLPIQYSFRFD